MKTLLLAILLFAGALLPSQREVASNNLRPVKKENDTRLNLRQVAQVGGYNALETSFGREQQQLADVFLGLGVPVQFNPLESAMVSLASDDVAKFSCNVPLCRLLRRLSKKLEMNITINIFGEHNEFIEIRPNEVNIKPSHFNSVEDVREFVHLKATGLDLYSTHPTEVFKHELTHLIFYKYAHGKNHFFKGRYRLNGIPGYPELIYFEEVLTFALENLAREKIAIKRNIDRRYTLSAHSLIDALLNEMSSFFPDFQDFVLSHPTVLELKDLTEFKDRDKVVDESLIRKKYKPSQGMVALTLPAIALENKGDQGKSRYLHIFLAADGRSYEFFSNYKISEIKNFPEFFDQQRAVLSAFFDITDTQAKTDLLSIRKAFANPHNRFAPKAVSCEALF